MLANSQRKALEFSYIVPSIRHMQFLGELRDEGAPFIRPITIANFSEKILVNNSHLKIEEIALSQRTALNGYYLFWRDYLVNRFAVVPLEQRKRLSWLFGRPDRNAVGNNFQTLRLRVAAIANQENDSDDRFFILHVGQIEYAARGLIDLGRKARNGALKINDCPLGRACELIRALQSTELESSYSYEDKGIGRDPSGKFGDWFSLLKPPWPLEPFFTASVCLGAAGFVLLFGPHRREILGAALFFAAVFLLLFGCSLGVRYGLLASINRGSENVGVVAVVIPELKFSDIQRQIFLADLVEGADHSALNQRPEALNRLSVHRADDILAARMVDCRVRELLVQVLVADPLIRAEQANLCRDRFANESGQSIRLHIGDNAGDDVALPLDRSGDNSLSGSTSPPASVAALVLVPVLGEATDESFIDFNNAAELFGSFDQRGSYLVAHAPSGFIRTEAHVSLNLQRAHSLLAGQHQMDDAKPLSEGLIRILKDGPGDDGETIAGRAARSTFGTLPMPFAGWQVIDSRIATTRAADSLRPSASLQIGFAGIFIREELLELRDSQLMDWFWILGHGRSPDVEERYHA